MASNKRSYDELVWKAANKYGVPPNLVQNVLLNESSGSPNAVSNRGAIGLMQVMPSTAKGYNVNEQQLYDPATNVDVGTHYLADLYHRYGNNPVGALVAYNAGPKRWEQVSSGNKPYNSLPNETQNYVNKVLNNNTKQQNNYNPQYSQINPQQSQSNLQYSQINPQMSMIPQRAMSNIRHNINQSFSPIPSYNQAQMQPYNDDLNYLINAYRSTINNTL